MLVLSAVLAVRLKFLFTILHTFWAMYILGLRSSWGTSQIRPSWFPSEHLLTPALSPFRGACVWSYAARRRLFIVLMTAAHISPNVFSLECSLATYSNYFIIRHNNSTHAYYTLTYYTSHSHTYIYIFYFTHPIHIFVSSTLHGRLAALGSLSPIQL